MSNPLDTDAGSELFSSYEAELKLVQADVAQKLDQINDLSGEPRKSAVRLAERALEEAQELVCTPFFSTVNVSRSQEALANLAPVSSIKCALKSPISHLLPDPR